MVCQSSTESKTTVLARIRGGLTGRVPAPCNARPAWINVVFLELGILLTCALIVKTMKSYWVTSCSNVECGALALIELRAQAGFPGKVLPGGLLVAVMSVVHKEKKIDAFAIR